MDKTIDKGVIKINDMSFFEFSRELMGYEIVNKENGFKIPKFILFWKGMTVTQIKNRYSLVIRKVTYDY